MANPKDRAAAVARKLVRVKRKAKPVKGCPNCGGMHFGQPPGECPFSALLPSASNK